ncbi:hypothetical protein [Accumulibacter sp.]|nr:hypothetical protein [Accumulibacter sp.]MBL8375168.1 hypothetical protein [Accumulibacter sp.]
MISNPTSWSAAHRMAREIPTRTGREKHRAISALLAKLLDLLRGVAA